MVVSLIEHPLQSPQEHLKHEGRKRWNPLGRKAVLFVDKTVDKCKCYWKGYHENTVHLPLY